MYNCDILNEFEDIIYISDMESYELVFVNSNAQKIFSADTIENKKCYEIIQGKTSPCEFCTNRFLSQSTFYCWEYTNLKFGRHFLAKDKLILWNGRKFRLEIAIDITEKQREKDKIQKALMVESTIVECLRILDMEKGREQAVERVMSIVGRFYMADRTYIWMLHENDAGQEYEWFARDVAPRAESLRERALFQMRHWKAALAEDGEVIAGTLASSIPHTLPEDAPHSLRKLEGLIVLPIMRDGNLVGCVGVDNPRYAAADSSLLRSVAYFIKSYLEKQEIKNYLEWLSFTDSLTRLGNRNNYIAVLQQMKKSVVHDFGVIFIDVNGLKNLNDTFGHDYGDRIIIKVADILRGIFTENIFRTGGDEYIVICRKMAKMEFDAKVADMRRAFAEAGDCEVACGVVWKSTVEDIDTLIRYADELMYIEKQSYYKSNLGKRPLHHSALLEETLQSLENGEFLVYLQPKVCLESGRLGGAEALIRKRGKDSSVIAPSYFIPLLESELLIRHIDFFVLHEVCKLLQSWRRQHISAFPISVNLSRITLMEHNIVEKISNVCKMYDIPTNFIDIEITESVGSINIESLNEISNELSRYGFTISLDDFGARYCNLSILTDIKFNYLKIDKTIIDSLIKNKRSRIIIKHCIDICTELENVASIAEGIENEEQMHILKEYKCNYGQGYYFSRPMDISRFESAYITNTGNVH